MNPKLLLGVLILSSIFCFAGLAIAQTTGTLADCVATPTISCLTYWVNQITAEITALQARQNQTQTPAQPAITSLKTYSLLGATDATTNGDVSNLQKALIKFGYSIGSDASGIFGAGTNSALKKFQADNGIAQTGTTGPITRAKLNSLVGSAASTTATAGVNTQGASSNSSSFFVSTSGQNFYLQYDVPDWQDTIYNSPYNRQPQGIVWKPGTSYNIIYWGKIPQSVSNVNISFTRSQWDGTAWVNDAPISIANNVPASQAKYNWSIPKDILDNLPAVEYPDITPKFVITVSDASNPNVFGQSNSFNILNLAEAPVSPYWSCTAWSQCNNNDLQQRTCTCSGNCTGHPKRATSRSCGNNGGKPYVFLTSPAAGTTFVQGQTYNITWDAGNVESGPTGAPAGSADANCGYTIRIEGYPPAISNVNGQIIDIATDITVATNISPEKRSYSWTLPDNSGGDNIAYNNLKLHLMYSCYPDPPTMNSADDYGQIINIASSGQAPNPVTNISVTGGYESLVPTNITGGQLGVINRIISDKVGSDGAPDSYLIMRADVLPTNATNTFVVWSVVNGTGSASIDPATGKLQGLTVGTVTVKATASDGSGIVGTEQITVLPYFVPVVPVPVNVITKLTVWNPTYTAVYTGQAVQMQAVSPAPNTTAGTKDETNNVTWSVDNTALATISSTGLLTTLKAGTVTITAKANDAGGVTGSYQMQITCPAWSGTCDQPAVCVPSCGSGQYCSSGQCVASPANPATSINITSIGGTTNAYLPGATVISYPNTLQMVANVLPANANQAVTWSIQNLGISTINPTTGVLTPTLMLGTSYITETVTATAQDGSNVSGSTVVYIMPPSNITVCTSNTDCGSGKICSSGACVASGCTATSCPSGQICNTSTGNCVVSKCINNTACSPNDCNPFSGCATVPTCHNDSDCNSGYYCNSQNCALKCGDSQCEDWFDTTGYYETPNNCPQDCKVASIGGACGYASFSDSFCPTGSACVNGICNTPSAPSCSQTVSGALEDSTGRVLKLGNIQCCNGTSLTNMHKFYIQGGDMSFPVYTCS